MAEGRHVYQKTAPERVKVTIGKHFARFDENCVVQSPAINISISYLLLPGDQ